MYLATITVLLNGTIADFSSLVKYTVHTYNIYNEYTQKIVGHCQLPVTARHWRNGGAVILLHLLGRYDPVAPTYCSSAAF